MLAVDTNVLARLLLRDDEAQFRKAQKLFALERDYTATPTVMLELVWVLESYQRRRSDIVLALNALLGLSNFKPKSKAAIVTAVSHYEAGMDFGDALHLSLGASDDGFVTFDKGLAKLAKRIGIKPPIELL